MKMQGSLAGLVLLAASGAQAHTQLKSSLPAEGGVLAPNAREMTLSFDGFIAEATCSARDSAGAAVAVVGAAKPQKEKLHVALTGELAPGNYVLTCRYKGTDRHELNATVNFSVAKQE